MESEGRKLDESLQRGWNTVTANVAKLAAAPAGKPRVLFILSHTGTSMMVSGEGSAADAMIRYAGGINAMQGFKGYKPMTSEAVLAAAPDVILVTQQGLDAAGGADKLWQHPGLALTPAAKKKQLVAMEALYLTGFGPRLPQAVGELAQKLRAPSQI
jgi:iron complex transport system substrate-binding protein